MPAKDAGASERRSERGRIGDQTLPPAQAGRLPAGHSSRENLSATQKTGVRRYGSGSWMHIRGHWREPAATDRLARDKLDQSQSNRAPSPGAYRESNSVNCCVLHRAFEWPEPTASKDARWVLWGRGLATVPRYPTVGGVACFGTLRFDNLCWQTTRFFSGCIV